MGGALILIGVLALIGFLVKGGQFVAFIAAVCLFVGGFMFIKALVKRREAGHSIDTMTDGVASAQSTLTELEAQPSAAE